MYHVNKLIIISGTGCVGKSFLLKKIFKGECPELCKQLGLDDRCTWQYKQAYELSDANSEVIDRLIVHYDYFSHYSSHCKFKYLKELINNSKSVIVLTLYVPHKILIQRITLRIIRRSIWLGIRFLIPYKDNVKVSKKRFLSICKLCRKRKIYMDGYSLFELHKKWFNFVDEYDIMSHWILYGKKSYTLISIRIMYLKLKYILIKLNLADPSSAYMPQYVNLQGEHHIKRVLYDKNVFR